MVLLVALDHRSPARPLARSLYPGMSSVACQDRKSTRLNSSHLVISYAVFCLKKKKRTPHVSGPGTAQAPDHEATPLNCCALTPTRAASSHDTEGADLRAALRSITDVALLPA